jgi:hypothetical protein
MGLKIKAGLLALLYAIPVNARLGSVPQIRATTPSTLALARLNLNPP